MNAIGKIINKEVVYNYIFIMESIIMFISKILFMCMTIHYASKYAISNTVMQVICANIYLYISLLTNNSRVCAYRRRGISFIYICSIDIFILKYISSRIPPTCLSIFSKLATLIIATKLFSFAYYVSYHIHIYTYTHI